MNILICNIGSSDLAGAAVAGLRGLSERERAARLLDDSAAQLDLPIIGKALRHVQRQPGELAQVVLVASNQGDTPPDDPAALADWGKDTLRTAQVVKRRLGAPAEHWQAVPPERIAIWEIAGEQGGERDPSDYDGVRRFFERALPALAASYPDASVYLEVTGGTPAMTTGLLVAGTEVFGARAEVLYVHPRQPLPATLNTGKRIQAGPLRAALRSNVATYDYHAALCTLRAQRVVIGDRLAEGAPELLEALLDYARCRFNFDFRGAREALGSGADRLGDGRWRAEVMQAYAAVDQIDRAGKLEEVYHGAAARYEVGSYADFLTQVVRFQENALRALCLDRGAVFLNRRREPHDDGSFLQQAWSASVGFHSQQGNAQDRLTTRGLLRGLAQHLAHRRGEDLGELFGALDRLNELANLRNSLTHTFEGVSQRELAEHFAGADAPAEAAAAIVPHVARCYALLAGRAPGPAPFVALNELIAALLREARR